jgi:hypothetical protein
MAQRHRAQPGAQRACGTRKPAAPRERR